MFQASKSDSIDLLLGQVCKLHYHRVHALLERLGLYRGQPHMLKILWERDGSTQTELAERLHVQPSTVTKMVQRMEKAGFVERRPDPEDQRVSRVYLTDAGRAVQETVKQVWRTMEEETLQGFTLEERELLRGFLSRMRENLLQVIGDVPLHRPGLFVKHLERNR